MCYAYTDIGLFIFIYRKCSRCFISIELPVWPKYDLLHVTSYVGQTGRSIEIRLRERIRYIKTNNPVSAYALHILDHRHEYGSPEHTV